MKLRSLWILAAAALLAPSDPAAALSLRIMDSEVTVDTFARAETRIDDPEPSTRRNIRVQVANTTFVDLDAATALGEAQSFVLPPIAEPGDRPIQTKALLKVDISSRGVLSAAASAMASGFVELLVRSGPPGDNLTTLLIDLDLLRDFNLENPFSARYWVENLTTGTTIFDSNASGFPDTVMLPLQEGHLLRVNYQAQVSASVGGTAMSRTDLDLISSITVVPEPGTWLLLGLGLAGTLAVGRRGLSS